MANYRAFLKESYFFSALSDEEIEVIHEACQLVGYKDGQVLFYEGESANRVFLILDGVVEIYRDYGNPDQDMLTELKANQMFGELALITDLPRAATAVAWGGVELLAIDKDDFRKIIAENRSIALSILRSVSATFQESTENYSETLKERNRVLEKANEELEKEIQERKRVDEELRNAHAELEERVKERTAELKKINDELKRQSTIDGLTHIPNRRRFDECIYNEWKRMARQNQPLSLIMCDVDHFKLYNDHYGHQAGDDCLRVVANAISGQLRRPADVAARYGGEEFAVILPETFEDGACHVAESIREGLLRLQIPHKDSPVHQHVTLSLGVACMTPDAESTIESLIETADKALFKAKGDGRNRYVAASDAGEA
ncbi:MAG: diguanylate cyclase [Desulfobacterales bacterium]|nr:diguanylate cyclase [Desulfobacterales bacterium]